MMRMRQLKTRCRSRQRRIRVGPWGRRGSLPSGGGVCCCLAPGLRRWHVVARALREGGELHLGSLRGTLDPGTFAEEDWGFLAQQTLEKLLKALLVLHCQEPPRSSRITGAR